MDLGFVRFYSEAREVLVQGVSIQDTPKAVDTPPREERVRAKEPRPSRTVTTGASAAPATSASKQVESPKQSEGGKPNDAATTPSTA